MLGLDQNSELILINIAQDLSRGHWWDLITLESISYLYCLIVCLCPPPPSLPPPPPPHMESWVRCLGGCIFPIPEEIVYSFFNGLFDMFLNSTNLAYVSQLGEEDLVYDYLFTSQKGSHSLSDMAFFVIFSLILSHLELSRILFPKLTSSILMETVWLFQ